jgi:D-2-hydroxyacid dehydrogenase (NADP+)
MQPTILILERENPADLDFYRAAIAQAHPDAALILAATPAEAEARGTAASILVGKAHGIPATLVAAMPGLKWIQALTTGVDHLLEMNLPTTITITSARGVHGPQMSELAMLFMLSLSRDFPRMLRNQSQATWERWPQRLLLGKCVGIVGVGAISTELAACCKLFGMRVLGVSNALRSAPGFDELRPRSALRSVAAKADFLIALTPYSAETHHLIDADVIAAIKPGGYLINIARGKVVDEQALIAALGSGALAGAGLDVFAEEPCPPDNPLWRFPNVIMTPHIGGMSDSYAQQLLPLILHNLGAFIAGDRSALRNRVDR